MTTRTGLLLAGLAALAIALAATNWHPVRAGLYLVGWAIVATVLVWNDRRGKAGR